MDISGTRASIRVRHQLRLAQPTDQLAAGLRYEGRRRGKRSRKPDPTWPAHISIIFLHTKQRILILIARLTQAT